MGDNPRPALYGASYVAFPVKGANGPGTGPADVAGRYCESGDVIARDVPLPDLEPGDLLCVPVAGAYQLSMASAYNLVPPPPAIMVDGASVTPLLRRAGVDELLARDAWPGAFPRKR
jgi:diaminopimelate decarboxylase